METQSEVVNLPVGNDIKKNKEKKVKKKIEDHFEIKVEQLKNS